MKNKKEAIEEVVEVEEEELSPKELKKIERKNKAEKRKKAKQKDKVARFAGIIMLGMILLTGFLLWVAGEMKQDPKSIPQPTIRPSYQNEITPPMKSNQNSIIVR